MKFVNMRVYCSRMVCWQFSPWQLLVLSFWLWWQLPFEGLNQAIAVFLEKDCFIYAGLLRTWLRLICFSIDILMLKIVVEMLPAGKVICVFFLHSLKSSYIPEKGEEITDATSQGLAWRSGDYWNIIIGLVVGSILLMFIQKHIVIKMPEQFLKRSPSNLSYDDSSFFVIFFLSMVVYILAKMLTRW